MNNVYWLEEQVKNKVNNTNLEFISIAGLFGRYNIKIPFKKQSNIFIGENGLGKTTILNCIYFLLEKKFSRLTSIPFSDIRVKFKNDDRQYHISLEDLREYGKSKDRGTLRYLHNRDDYVSDVMDRILFYNDVDFELNPNSSIEQVTVEFARRMNIPISFARNQVVNYLEDRGVLGENRRSGDGKNVASLAKAITENVSQRVIYLPTYRRIEDDFASLNLHNEELNKRELLIRFGMSDVQNSIEIILDKIRMFAMKGFTEMTGVLLKQYVDGADSNNIRRLNDVNNETVKIVLDRVGKAIEQQYKDKILHLISSGDIKDPKYYYLLDLINKLIDNYDVQKKYDDRIKKFADTCNKYMIDKYFHYNQSTLSLDIFLDSKPHTEHDKQVIQLTQLSSGEKQIVSLFSKLYLDSDERRSIIIIDEPELSLSIEWQKMLLPDIMRTENCDLLLTVTHSPFIFENELDNDAREIRKYIRSYK